MSSRFVFARGTPKSLGRLPRTGETGAVCSAERSNFAKSSDGTDGEGRSSEEVEDVREDGGLVCKASVDGACWARLACSALWRYFDFGVTVADKETLRATDGLVCSGVVGRCVILRDAVRDGSGVDMVVYEV